MAVACERSLSSGQLEIVSGAPRRGAPRQRRIDDRELDRENVSESMASERGRRACFAALIGPAQISL